MKDVGPIAVRCFARELRGVGIPEARIVVRATVSFSHYRTKDQDEVGVVIEDRRGPVVGIEVKASATVPQDFRDCGSCRKESAIVLCAGWCCTTITVC